MTAEGILWFPVVSVYGLIVINLQNYSTLLYNSILVLSILNLNLFVLVIAHPDKLSPFLLTIPGTVISVCTWVINPDPPMELQIFLIPNTLAYVAVVIILIIDKCRRPASDSTIALLEQEGVV